MEYDGRYEGSDGELTVALRVDTDGCGVVSADLFRGTDYLTSTRTLPGQQVRPGTGSWAAEFSTEVATTGSGTVPGTIAVTADGEPPGRLVVRLRPDLAVASLPAGREVTVPVERIGPELRELGLETETEAGVEPPAPVVFEAAAVDHRECLRRAGFAVTATGLPTPIPRPDQPWDYARVYTLLHDLMTAAAQSDLSAAAWQLQLLRLSASTKPQLFGIMFDSAGLLPRQGCAVFLDEIRRYAAAHQQDPDRNGIRTTVHELGHALNLAHRWEPAIGLPGSTSFMNYPWGFEPGGEDGYWPNFRFTFDADELDHLRHAPLGAVRPGDATFHSVAYWAGQGWLPPPPPPPGSVLRLSLQAPPAGIAFTLGQPVFLEVVLHNVGDRPVRFEVEPLDPKTGPLRVAVRRLPGAGEPEQWQVFAPLVMGCTHPAGSGPGRPAYQLPAHDLVSNNLNIGFGARGPTFREPGIYEVVAVLFLAEPWGQVASTRLTIRVDPDPARDAETLLRPDVGAWFALGGCDALATAGDLLEEVRQRRQARNGAADPVVAAIVRAAGINAGRRVTRFRDGQFKARAADPVRAGALLGSLDDAALRTFDPHTAAGTGRLAEHYASMNRDPAG